MYKPLPDNVTIAESKIHGLGLFATRFIRSETVIGLTHVYDENFEDSYIRTPLGGFFNHNSKNPNCKVIKEKRFLYLVADRDIQPEEELTARYTLYNPEVL